MRLLWLAHALIPLDALMVEVNNRALPKNGRIAILLRGQAFRQGRRSPGCQTESIPAQLRCTDSLMKNIVGPLEHNRNKVEFFVVNGNRKNKCSAFDELLMPKLGNRVVSVKQYDSHGQADNMYQILQTFSARQVEQNWSNRYGLIIIVRHDEEWTNSISEWPTADFHKLNLFSLCEESTNGGSKWSCVNDVLHMMPGSLWRGFRDAVGTEHCFNNKHRRGVGHQCFPAFSERVGEDNIAFITDWRPTGGVRDPNDIAQLSRHEF